MDSKVIKPLVESSFSFAEVLRKLDKYPNTRNVCKLRSLCNAFKIDITHFRKNGAKPAKTKLKVCPACYTLFEVTTGNWNQETCSYTCANTHFATRRRKPKAYRTICFKHHSKRCIICNERLMVEAHHYDGNKKNNAPENLIPLCPTHHQYWHSRFRHLIKQKIDDYRKSFILIFYDKVV